MCAVGEEIPEPVASYWPKPYTDCSRCAGTGAVCENHRDRAWGGLCCWVGERGRCAHGACGCGAGEPCPDCWAKREAEKP